MQTPLQKEILDKLDTIKDFPKPGILFKDISPILMDPKLYSQIVKDFVQFSQGKIDIVCGIESRGFLFGIAIANALNVPFVLVRKKGKLPPPVISQSYDLEYGTSEIEVREGLIKPGQRVLIHDDLLATGGTAEAAAILIEKLGAKATQFSFLIGLQALNGKEKLLPYNNQIHECIVL